MFRAHVFVFVYKFFLVAFCLLDTKICIRFLYNFSVQVLLEIHSVQTFLDKFRNFEHSSVRFFWVCFVFNNGCCELCLSWKHTVWEKQSKMVFFFFFEQFQFQLSRLGCTETKRETELVQRNICYISEKTKTFGHVCSDKFWQCCTSILSRIGFFEEKGIQQNIFLKLEKRRFKIIIQNDATKLKQICKILTLA